MSNIVLNYSIVLKIFFTIYSAVILAPSFSWEDKITIVKLLSLDNKNYFEYFSINNYTDELYYLRDKDIESAEQLYERARKFSNEGQVEKAKIELAKMSKLRGTANGYYTSAKILQSIGHYRDAINDYYKAISINAKMVYAIRELAWLYATCVDDEIRDGEKALQLSNKAISFYKSPSNYISLAAAYAELENFKLAVLFQKNAIEMALDIGDESSIDHYQKILKSYQSKIPWREGQKRRDWESNLDP